MTIDGRLVRAGGLGDTLMLGAYDLGGALPYTSTGIVYNSGGLVGCEGWDEAYIEPDGNWVEWDLATGVVTLTEAGLYRVAADIEGSVTGADPINLATYVRFAGNSPQGAHVQFVPAGSVIWVNPESTDWRDAGTTLQVIAGGYAVDGGSIEFEVSYTELFVRRVG